MPAKVDETTRRIQLMLKHGGEWMPPQTLTAFAASKVPDNQLLEMMRSTRKAITHGFRQAGIKADDGWKQLTDDPVLQKRTSLALAVKRYVSGAIGPWPVKDEDVSHIQARLQKQGFGSDLHATGAWSPGWDAAWHQWSDKLYESQLAGKQTGSMTFGKALHLLTAVLPKEAANALVGFGKALPHAARQLAADAVSAVVMSPVGALDSGHTRPADVAGGFIMGQTPQQFQSAKQGETIRYNQHGQPVNAVGDTQTFTKHVLGRAADDIGTMLILHDAMKLGAQASKAIGEGFLRQGATELTQAEAERAGGVITRTLAGNAGTAAERAPGAIGGAVNRMATAVQRESNLASNIPGAARIGGWVGRLSDADGLYYKARTLAATPYRIPGVAATGSAVSTLGLEGAKVRGIATVAGGLGGEELRGVNSQETEVLNTVDDAIRNRLDFTVLGHHVQPSLDDLQFFLHGPTSGPHAASAKVGESVDDVRNGAIDFMGRLGFDGVIERATGTATDDAIEHMGGVQNYTTFWSNNIQGHAANWWADQHIDDAAEALFNPETGPLTPFERMKLHRDLSHEARVAFEADPKFAMDTTKALVASHGGEELAMRIRKDIDQSRLQPRDYMKGNGQNWVHASRIVRDRLLPHFRPDALDESGFIHDPGEAARLGLARTESLTKQSATRLIDSIEAEYTELEGRMYEARGINNVGINEEAVDRAVAPTFDEYNALNFKVRDVLHKEFNVDSLKMPHTLPEKIAKMRDFADGLASDAYVAVKDGEVPHEVTRAMRELHDLGYKPVFGTDIGWLHAAENQLDLFNGPLTTRRKVIEHLGLSADNHGTLPIGFYRRSGIRNQLQQLVDDGKIVLPPHWTPDTVLAYLEKGDVLDKSPGGLFRAAAQLHVTKAARADAETLLEAEGIANPTKAMIRARASEEAVQALQLRDVPRKKVIEALTDPKAFRRADDEAQAIMAGVELDAGELAPFTTKQANEIYRAIVRGSAAPKAYMLGLSRVDDLFRASMGIAGSGPVGRTLVGAGIGAAAGTITTLKSDHPGLDGVFDNAVKGGAIGAGAGLIGGQRLGWAMANLPNRLVQLRNDLRFTLSPAFSFRRIAKTNVKLSLEGVAPTIDPLTTMEKAGTLAEDRARLRDVVPGFYNEISDDADRYLRENDVFGFYNARNYEAYALGEWSRKNPTATVEEQRAFITKTFAYGSRTAEGRTALERTANFVFFPFSFEKTLYRNLGGYLLDHPAQRILLTKGLAEYNQFNQEHLEGNNPLAASWWEKHVPVLEEALRLNAFAHGISAGELGGINRPLLNLFLPQSWSSSEENLDTLHRFIPALKDFDRVRREIAEQGDILETVGHNMLATLKHAPTSPGAPSSVAETRQAQIEDGFAMQRTWFEAYAPVLDYNDGRAKDKQLKFPLDGTWGEFGGESITRDNVNRIIGMKYPAFNSAGGAVTAIKKKTELKTYLLKHKGTEYGDYAQQIFDLAAKLETVMAKPGTPASSSREWTAKIRTAATWLAERDAAFYRLYNRNLRRAFGPLESVG